MTNINVTELKNRIKEYVSANKSDKLLLRQVSNYFRGELELLHEQGDNYEEVCNFLVKTVSEARGK